MSNLDRFIETFLNGAVLAKYTPAILSGVWVTVELSVLIVIAGTVLGVALACIRAYRIRPVSFVIVIYADIFRALPPLVLILLAYFGLPNIGLSLSSSAVLFVILGLTLGAFAEEIVWAGITATDKGQWEAARSTGLGFGQSLIHVVLP
ncbi:MAG TPA: ABC transporter permease subunit, partial [Paracoccus sp.]|nr:ABC transporter permease subunit [Paracoccus sp. (in: a-proteobacteria)]